MDSGGAGPPRRNPRRGMETADEGSDPKSPGGTGKKRSPEERKAESDGRVSKKATRAPTEDEDATAAPAAAPAPDLQGLAVELNKLRQTLKLLVGGAAPVQGPPPLVGTSAAAQARGRAGAWASLTCQRTGHIVCVREAAFSLGRSARCQVQVEDSLVPSMAARIHLEGGVPVLVCMTGTMRLNDTLVLRGSRKTLRAGDRVSLSGVETHVYDFDWSHAVAPTPLLSVAEVGRRSSLYEMLSTSAGAGAEHEPEPEPEPELAHEPVPERAPEPAPAAAGPGPQASLLAAKAAELRGEYAAMVLSAGDVDTSFDAFPYHLAEPTKQILLDSVAVFLAQPALEPVAKRTALLAPALLLEGPYGTELYQVELVKALAKQHDAALLLLDPAHPALAPDSARPAAVAPEDETGPGPVSSRLESLFLPTKRLKSSSSKAQPRFRKGMRVRYVSDGLLEPPSGVAPRGPWPGAVGQVLLNADDEHRTTVAVRFDQPIIGGNTLHGLCEDGLGFFVASSQLRLETDDTLAHDVECTAVDALLEVAAARAPCIVCVRDVESVFFASHPRLLKFERALEALAPGVVLVGLRTTTMVPSGRLSSQSASGRGDRSMSPALLTASRPPSASLVDLSFFEQLRNARDEPAQSARVARLLKKLLPTRVTVQPPARGPELAAWRRAMEADIKLIKLRANRALLARCTAKIGLALDVNKVDERLLQHELLSEESATQALGWALGYHARTGGAGPTRDEAATLPLSAHCVDHALRVQRDAEDLAAGALGGIVKDLQTDNEFEKKILSDVVPADELNVTFSDVGALESIKTTLRELVLLPLTRPELFRRGQLRKPSKGVLLFGPPGTGKTMLAKAVATECRANFLNLHPASLSSKWFGDSERYAQAVFSVASKISPCVIFIDEVDGLLGKRDKTGEHEAVRKVKNTIMTMWDGLTTSDNERVIVLAATNRPFDLDDAVLRRLPRRLLVDLPDASQREQILRVVCKHEELEADFNFSELAKQTEGFSGSDLHNLCVAAAYVPVREVLEAERVQGLDPHRSSEPDAPPMPLRALGLRDFIKARASVSISVSEDAASVAELRAWNDVYGENGSRRPMTLPYYM